jgi:hypothetical protein
MAAPARRARVVPCPGVVAGRGLAGQGARATCPALARARSPARSVACPARARPPAPACPARVVTAPARPRARPSVPIARSFELGQRAAPTCARLVRGAYVRPCARAARVVRAVPWHGSPCPRLPLDVPVYPPVYFMCANHVVHVNEIGNSIWKLVTLVHSYS